jgi:hypothetical protein
MRPTIWLCQACGRRGASRGDLYAADSSCGTWAVEVWVDSILEKDGRVVSAEAAVADVMVPM